MMRGVRRHNLLRRFRKTGAPSLPIMRLIKNIGIVIVAVGIFVLWGKYHQRATRESGPPASVAEPAVHVSPYGFAPLPKPFVGPSDRLVILAPPHCPSEQGRRADELVRQLAADGIPCSRSVGANVSAEREATKDELDRLNRVMLGELPIVFINGRAKNNPDIADVEGEYRSTAN